MIWITVWIIWIQAARCVCVQYSSKSHGWILMKFSGNVLNGTRNKWLDFGSDLDHLDPGCQMFCVQHKSKTYGRILMKFTGYVWKGKRMKWLDFGSDPDLLDPWNVIFKDRYLNKLWMDCDDIFSKWPKWCKEQVIRFWEWSGSLSGSSGSRLPDMFVYSVAQNVMDGFWWNFQDMSEKVKGWNGWILEVIRITIWIFWIHEM